MVEAYAWKESSDDSDKLQYKVQLELIDTPKRKQNKVIKLFKDWIQCIEGGSRKQKKVILGYRKEFSSEKEWKAWVKSFPHSFYQLKKNGSFKLIKKGK
jgi:hypothetical protein|tara:strand:- start:552 stop:848 length:297 start_codon:yes stop_codon:yes gene_type:complete